MPRRATCVDRTGRARFRGIDHPADLHGARTTGEPAEQGRWELWFATAIYLYHADPLPFPGPREVEP